MIQSQNVQSLYQSTNSRGRHFVNKGSKSSKGRYHHSTHISKHFKLLPMAITEEYPPKHYTSLLEADFDN